VHSADELYSRSAVRGVVLLGLPYAVLRRGSIVCEYEGKAPSMSQTKLDPPVIKERGLSGLAVRTSNWSQKWFPASLIFALLVVVVVAVASICIGCSPIKTAKVFGDGFWNMITFTMQMAMVTIGGYVVADSRPVKRLIRAAANKPKNGKTAVVLVAFLSMFTGLLNWGLSLIFSGLLVRRMAEREDIRVDYKAASAAGYLGLGATWALGISSSAAQLQANAS